MSNYASLEDFAGWNRPQTNDAKDDSVITLLIDSASRYIESQTNTTFYPVDTTLLFDTPADPTAQIMFSANVLSVTTVNNGDGSVIAPSNLVLFPANSTRKTAIGLRRNSGITWQTNAGDPVQAISILCKTGDSPTTPSDIKEACLMIVKSAYNRRFGENMSNNAVATAAGVIITPEDIPSKATDIIFNHRRVGFA